MTHEAATDEERGERSSPEGAQRARGSGEPASATQECWGVGQWVDGDGARQAWEISNDEMNRDIGSAMKLVGELGIGAGHQVLITSMLSEAGNFWPLTIGVMLSGAKLSLSDATSGEAVRVAMFTRLLEYEAVLGITPEILDGLDDLGLAYSDVLGRVPKVFARPGAYERLVAAGLAPLRFALVGPAVAIARAPGERARVDATEWHVTDSHGVAAVTNRLPRAAAFHATPTHVATDFLEMPPS